MKIRLFLIGYDNVQRHNVTVRGIAMFYVLIIVLMFCHHDYPTKTKSTISIVIPYEL